MGLQFNLVNSKRGPCVNTWGMQWARSIKWEDVCSEEGGIDVIIWRLRTQSLWDVLIKQVNDTSWKASVRLNFALVGKVRAFARFSTRRLGQKERHDAKKQWLAPWLHHQELGAIIGRFIEAPGKVNPAHACKELERTIVVTESARFACGRSH